MGLFKNALKKFEDLKVKEEQPKATEPPQASSYDRPKAQLPSRSKETVKQSHQQVLKGDIFTPIDCNEPPEMFKRIQHAVTPAGAPHSPQDPPLHTNNFVNNLALEDQTFPIWPLPYSCWVTRDDGQIPGLAFNHTDAAQRVFGPDPNQNPAQFFFSPPKIKSWVFSADGLTQKTPLHISNLSKFSANTKFSVGSGSVEFPFVQGMGYVTAIYRGATPIIASQVGVQDLQKEGQVGPLVKYRAQLFNQVVWSVYVSGGELQLENPNLIRGTFDNGFIQIARGESKAYDDTAGIWPTDVILKGSGATYSLHYSNEGSSASNNSLVWALPHHQQVLDRSITDANMTLDSPTKGVMKAYVTNVLTMTEENIPTEISFSPWSEKVSQPQWSQSSLDKIKQAATDDVQQDVVGQANIDSMYTSGKILDKFAHVAWVTKFVLKDDQLTQTVMDKLKQAVDIFATNKQKFPLCYDTTWKGIVSSADPGADFGNAYYNDHHFHYGYHIHAVAMMAKIDENYLKSSPHVRDYITTLLRDVASPQQDKYFPQFRSFDWFHGHSWAHGLFASGDGKDEESSSEDYHCYFGMKLWAQVIGDANMESRANLMLAIMRRSVNMYMLYKRDNNFEPSNFIGNFVAGISFENKLDYSTYFGRGQVGDEWIHGIHMLPTTPISNYIRSSKYTKEEWDQWLAPIIDRITDGWKGILMLNYGAVDAKTAYNWFASNSFQPSQIDNGMSRTWSLAYLAGIGGN